MNTRTCFSLGRMDHNTQPNHLVCSCTNCTNRITSTKTPDNPPQQGRKLAQYAVRERIKLRRILRKVERD